MQQQCILENLEIFIDRRPRHLGIVGDLREIDDRRIDFDIYLE